MAPDRTTPEPPREPPDLSHLMARLALIRAEVEREDRPPPLPVNLVRMLLVLLALVFVPLLLAGPCGVLTGHDGKSGEESPMERREAPITPRSGQ